MSGLWVWLASFAGAAPSSGGQVLGFSSEGRFVAFQRFGVDPAGAATLELTLLEVATNSEVFKLERRLEGLATPEGQRQTQIQLAQKVRIEAGDALEQAGIEPGRHGLLVADPALPEASELLIAPDPRARVLSFVSDKRRRWSLSWRGVPLTTTACPAPLNRGLVLRLREFGQFRTRTLERDWKADASQGCTFGFEVSEVWTHRGSLAVLLRTLEGSGDKVQVHWRVVTARLDPQVLDPQPPDPQELDPQPLDPQPLDPQVGMLHLERSRR